MEKARSAHKPSDVTTWMVTIRPLYSWDLQSVYEDDIKPPGHCRLSGVHLTRNVTSQLGTPTSSTSPPSPASMRNPFAASRRGAFSTTPPTRCSSGRLGSARPWSPRHSLAARPRPATGSISPPPPTSPPATLLHRERRPQWSGRLARRRHCRARPRRPCAARRVRPTTATPRRARADRLPVHPSRRHRHSWPSAVVERLITAGQWQSGGPAIAIVSDADHDVTRLVWSCATCRSSWSAAFAPTASCACRSHRECTASTAGRPSAVRSSVSPSSVIPRPRCPPRVRERPRSPRPPDPCSQSPRRRPRSATRLRRRQDRPTPRDPQGHR